MVRRDSHQRVVLVLVHVITLKASSSLAAYTRHAILL